MSMRALLLSMIIRVESAKGRSGYAFLMTGEQGMSALMTGRFTTQLSLNFAHETSFHWRCLKQHRLFLYKGSPYIVCQELCEKFYSYHENVELRIPHLYKVTLETVEKVQICIFVNYKDSQIK